MKKALIIAVITFGIIGCTQSQDKHNHSHTEKISLNKGEKWKVDENMMLHIRNIEQSIQAFTTNEDKQYVELGTELQSHLDLLTSNCTMKGQAHDELHKWLVPFMGLVEDLSDTKQNGDVVFQDIEASMKTFNKYFD